MEPSDFWIARWFTMLIGGWLAVILTENEVEILVGALAGLLVALTNYLAARTGGKNGADRAVTRHYNNGTIKDTGEEQHGSKS